MSTSMQRSLIGFLLTVAAVLLYWRTFYGLDVMDESHYLAMPHAFGLGARPFFDENTISQTAGVLLIPLVVLYERVHGSSDGIVLFIRQLFFVLNGLSAFVVYRFALNYVRQFAAFAVALLVFTYVPLSVGAISYDTLGYLCLLNGVLLLGLSFFSERPRSFLFSGSFILGIGCYAYPTLALVTSITLLVFSALKKHGAWKSLLAGIAIPTVFALATVAWIGKAQILYILGFFNSLGMYGVSNGKFHAIILNLVHHFSWGTVAIGAILLSVYAPMLLKRFTWFLWLLVVPLSYSILRREQVVDNYFLLYVSLAGFLLLRIYNFRREDYKFRLLWILQGLFIVGALTFAWTSGNGIDNASLGAISATVISLIGIIKIAEYQKLPTQYLLSVIICASVFQIVCLYHEYYMDGPRGALTEQITEGPFSGIYTTKTIKQFIDSIQTDVKDEARSAKSVFFFDDFPAGYLMSNMRPSGATLWPLQNGSWLHYDRRFISDYYSDCRKLPDVVFHVKRLSRPSGWYDNLSTGPDSLGDSFLPPVYSIVKDNADYTVLRLQKTCKLPN